MTNSSLRIFTLLVLILFVSTSISAQDAQVSSRSYRVMLNKLLDHSVPETDVPSAATAPEGTLFLDAREPAEYNVSHINGARLVGYDHFDVNNLQDIPKETPIIVYCSVGYRSEKVSEQLMAAGYQNVSNLYGGIFEWKNSGNQVVTPTGEVTNDVHVYSRSWGIWLKEGNRVY